MEARSSESRNPSNSRNQVSCWRLRKIDDYLKMADELETKVKAVEAKYIEQA